MNTILLTHPACLGHDTGAFHPECPDRLRAVLAALEAEEFATLDRREAPRATTEQLGRVHPAAHVERVLALRPGPGGHLAVDADTVISEGSVEAALRAAGAGVAAVDAVLGGEASRAFCAVRPPGHHAEPDTAMGFCLFNNAAVAALHARAAHGVPRVAVVDFDVHHGNGTEAMFAADPTLFYASSHQHPFYPGTGAAAEAGLGNIRNAPLPAGATGEMFRVAWADTLLPALDRFAPGLLVISAGFDAHARDPLAQLRAREADFLWLTEALCGLADRHCGGRVVSTLEGGYDLEALASSAAAHVRGLMVS